MEAVLPPSQMVFFVQTPVEHILQHVIVFRRRTWITHALLTILDTEDQILIFVTVSHWYALLEKRPP